MSSNRALSAKRNAFTEPPSDSGGGNKEDEPSPSKKPARQVNVYDAVAGRVSTRSVLPQGMIHSHDDTLLPEEVLFRRQDAPTRFAENDVYFANESIPAGNSLPDSDLLKAIHTYTSDFYDNATANRGRTDWRSMDETALIAMGILLEEAATESLGETGDLAFVEGEEIHNTEDVPTSSQIAERSERKRRSRRSRTVVGGYESDLEDFRPKGKRKKPGNEKTPDTG
ncbi:hypothetical protein FQN54_003721 [Arachnomyces sp. PD_36]|nr:hypothetical protein FQN54_003721 [Arachnomyces sp. PD_36]